MQIADTITELKLGNGTSVLIFANIASALPTSVGAALTQAASKDSANVAIYAGAFFLTTLGIVYVQEAERKIPMNYASRYRNSALSRQSYLPFKVMCCPALQQAVLCCAVLCCAVLCCAVLCCAVLCCAVLCCAVLCCVLRCDVLRCAALCCASTGLVLLRCAVPTLLCLVILCVTCLGALRCQTPIYTECAAGSAAYALSFAHSINSHAWALDIVI